MLYGTITEFCTEESCPLMSAGPKYEYHWADGTTVKKPIKCSAPKYIDYLMTWVQDQLDDENIFPSKIGLLHLFCFTMLMINFIDIRCSISKELYFDSKDNFEKIISSVCSHLSSTFSTGCSTRRRSAFKHQF